MILILNGPNLNLLGSRETGVYGHLTLADLDERCRAWAGELGQEAECRQSNSESTLVEWLHGASEAGATGVVLNGAGYSHSSVALRDAVSAIALSVIEVHLSNVFAREPFRHTSLLSAVCRGTITGLGPLSYKAAIGALADLQSEGS
ncbi:MAG: type II 3-dehydroquinate dehydratase [Trueperaceae bacterium]